MLIKLKTLMVFFCLIILTSISMSAQEFSEIETEVYNTVVKLFNGMRAGDSTAVRSVFSKESRMYTNSTNKDGVNITQEGSLESFLKAVGTPHDVIWDEKIWNTTIQVDLGVAQVWTEYAFYAGEKFSHCGIDAFQLLKEDEGWKIIQIIDTRKQKNCILPK